VSEQTRFQRNRRSRQNPEEGGQSLIRIERGGLELFLEMWGTLRDFTTQHKSGAPDLGQKRV